MWKAPFATLILVLCVTGSARAHSVTFQVDMSQVGTIDATVSVAGNFQIAAGYPADWTPGATVLTDPDLDEIYTLTVDLPDGTYEYKFINGTAWGQDETVPSACQVNANREMTITGDTVLDVVCFGECDPCVTTPENVTVTLQVDMRGLTINQMVSVGGSFQNDVVGETWTDWTPGEVELTDPDGDGIYAVTFVVPEATYEYKYINGTAWGQDETVPGSCDLNANRPLVVTGPGPIVIPSHCFSSCAPCEIGAGLCSDPIELACNTTSWIIDSSQYTNNIGSYSCSVWDESGPEVVFSVQLPLSDTEVTATISNLSADLDIFFIAQGSCSSGQCHAGDSAGDTTVTATGIGPGTFNIVVDGYQGNTGIFDLQLQCADDRVFLDDFEDGTTDAWSSTVGD